MSDGVGLPWLRPLRRAGELLVFAVAPLFLNGAMLLLEPRSRGGVAYDFREAFLPAARAVLDGRSPFGPATVAALRPGTAFVYPPVAAFVFAPIAWLPTQVAGYTVSLLVLACVPASLWVLGVRDWRCYGATLLWSPVVSSIRLGALSPVLALLVALVWRYRSRVGTPALVLAGAMALKLFLWPLFVWLAATRRWRSVAVGVLASGLLLVVPWAALGFAGLREYPRLLQVLSSIEAPESYTVAAVVSKAGGGWRSGEVAGYLAGLTLLAAAVYAGRRNREAASFVLVLAAALVLSPIVWIHYFALLLVPIAIGSRRLGPSWLMPLAFCAFPITPGDASWPAIATVLVLASAAPALRGRPPLTARLGRRRHGAAVTRRLRAAQRPTA